MSSGVRPLLESQLSALSASLGLGFFVCRVGILMAPASWVSGRVFRMRRDVSTSLPGLVRPHQRKTMTMEVGTGRLGKRCRSLTEGTDTCEEEHVDKRGLAWSLDLEDRGSGG